MAKLQGMEDVVSLMTLYLEENVLALYVQMDEKEQLSASKIEQYFRKAYTERERVHCFC